MSGTTNSPHEQDSKNIPRSWPYAVIALTLWSLAVVCSAIDALLAYDRIKVLLFMGGLLMMDIAAAVLMSLIWYLNKYRLGPLADYEAALKYGYRAGLIAHREARNELRVIVPHQDTHGGYLTASNGVERSDGRTR